MGFVFLISRMRCSARTKADVAPLAAAAAAAAITAAEVVTSVVEAAAAQAEAAAAATQLHSQPAPSTAASCDVALEVVEDLTLPAAAADGPGV